MAAPPKPWESPGVNRQQNPIGSTVNSLAGSSPGTANLPPCCQPTAAGAPPALPSRPGSQVGLAGSRFGSGYSSYSPYSSQMGMYSSPYSSFGSSYGYGGYGGGYGGYGGFGNYGYNRMGPDDYNSFARHAEENSRQAFQSIESIVNAFTSVSMMLDSTFQAVYNSFRAVIGVADNFSRLKLQLSHVFSAFALFRTLRYLYRKLLVLLRLRPAGYAEEAWTEASDVVEQLAAEQAKDPKKTSWPIFLFFGIILGAPWLIWKLISKLTDPSAGNGWANGDDDHFVARAEYDFKAEGQEEVSFKAGKEIAVAPKEMQPKVKGWLLASVDGKKVGLIPANYVKVLGKKRGRKSLQGVQQPLASSTQEPAQQSSCCKGGNKQQSSCCDTQSEPNMESVFQDTSSTEMTQAGLAQAESSMEPVFQGTSQTGLTRSESNMEPVFPSSPQAEMNAEDILVENDHEM